MKIVLSGGGTLGPVVPLIAIAESYREFNPEVKFIWIGTKTGPERVLVENNGIPFLTIGSAKWRRYFSLLNIIDLFKLIIAFFHALVILIREKPDLLISAGGYVSVPVHFAGAFLGMPAWVHQQDAQIGLANKLMFKLAFKTTAALAETAAKLPPKKTEWIGNPSRDLQVSDKNEARNKFGIPEGKPIIFALGGGTGSATINQLVLSAIPQLPEDWHVIHLVGKERPKELSERAAGIFPNYHVYDFFVSEMKDAYAVADIVVARAGFSTLTELAVLSKPAIILPMFGTHQEENARVFAKNGGIIMLDNGINGLRLAQMLKELVPKKQYLKELGDKLHDLLPQTDPKKIIEIIELLTKEY
ncbi:MAG: UDP-N-acetylglucosamine--N-acetylmuramyl-(pentapeptide) pyrophosphoryl-undecaprenol N-acetylglucosamine transferase [Patescibacteria group bacterium]|jgi:UDP-N-acetylglucosamine--N-acetylmuramyl-(pentapeptide) pyrophosphoryl-undecaprenol N-acetylglucosamine transferase